MELRAHSSTSLVVALPMRAASVSAVSLEAALLGLVTLSMESDAMVC